jgi:hypothetical protein
LSCFSFIVSTSALISLTGFVSRVALLSVEPDEDPSLEPHPATVIKQTIVTSVITTTLFGFIDNPF